MLPARFMLYAWLALALRIATWLARPNLPKIVAGRFAMTCVVCAFCVPNATQGGQWTRLHIPSIFTAERGNALPSGANLFILPFSGDHIGAQYAAGMNFRLVAQGYLGGGIAQPFSSWPLIAPLFNNQFDEVDPREFAAFLTYLRCSEGPHRTGCTLKSEWRRCIGDRGRLETLVPEQQHYDILHCRPLNRLHQRSWPKSRAFFSRTSNVTPSRAASG